MSPEISPWPALRIPPQLLIGTQVSVSPDGKISMQLIDEVQAAGKTPEQLTSAITQSLGKYMNHPEVNVKVATVNSKKYFISGEVLRPGAFPRRISIFKSLSASARCSRKF